MSQNLLDAQMPFTAAVLPALSHMNSFRIPRPLLQELFPLVCVSPSYCRAHTLDTQTAHTSSLILPHSRCLSSFSSSALLWKETERSTLTLSAFPAFLFVHHDVRFWLFFIAPGPLTQLRAATFEH